jgi:DUF1680 family protein
MNAKTLLLESATLLLGLPAIALSPIPDKITPAIQDRQDFQIPDRVHLTGWLGSRIDANEANRLVKLDSTRLLEGYRNRPGRQSWDGEHVGKWLHAATLAWVNTGDSALRVKLDYIAVELVKCQLEDGYLGTYLEKDRWTEWDVWAHKYNLLGLLTYMRYTGNQAPLPACRRMADLLCKTFGDQPGQRDILLAGHHKGMAPTSVLEPMVLLYRFTGEPRYLDFCKYILRAWEQPNGPKIISTLLMVKRVDKVGNGKAYEMLSCLNGALEYYRTIGEPQILQACLNAWQDIVDNRLYITGAASYGELFHDNYDLPNVNNVGETCVTVTWLQFNAQLLRLTGEARFAEQLEHVVLNQLLGAQKCDGSAWGYYVQMEGKKPYSSTLDGHCCLSSGPRGVALIPTFAISTDSEGVVVNLYDSCSANVSLRDHTPIKVIIDSRYPSQDQVRVAIEPPAEKDFALKCRIPSWCQNAAIEINHEKTALHAGEDGYVKFKRKWKKGDEIELRLRLEPRVVIGNHKNEGKAAVLYGPLVLAADAALLPEIPGLSLAAIALAGADLHSVAPTPEPAPGAFKSCGGAQVFRANAIARRSVGPLKAGSPISIKLAPFADAGTPGSAYKVWLPLHQDKPDANLLMDGQESRSRHGNLEGSIIDDDPQSFVVTFDAKPAAQDWFAVALDEPVLISRIAFAHGNVFHDGGWFDASGGKPLVQAKLTKDGSWETIGELTSYPATTATESSGLQPGQQFSCSLKAPVQAWSVRVVGKPACGDNPRQAFSSCAELQALGP